MSFNHSYIRASPVVGLGTTMETAEVIQDDYISGVSHDDRRVATDYRASVAPRWSLSQQIGVGLNHAMSYSHANSTPSTFSTLPPGSMLGVNAAPTAQVDHSLACRKEPITKQREPRQRWNDVKTRLHKQVGKSAEEAGLNGQIIVVYTLRMDSIGHPANKSDLTMTSAAQEGLARLQLDLKAELDRIYMAYYNATKNAADSAA
ncbi:hypothetical protein EIP91_006398 [Steccherinum ochraceum]|uniref:Uncharacterized protein n=1 Tax=Steccherinum ochraceum TaxID=92696 RepID=A0A4R0RBM1_9APHY|nr:hypothetical protein EIP91_006398 [Steccherinum ochraceum]